MAKQTIIINPLDNVAVALCNLQKGGIYEGVTLAEDVAKGHKFALRDIKQGENIIKYGSPIACATADIKKGGHVVCPRFSDFLAPFRSRSSSQTTLALCAMQS